MNDHQWIKGKICLITGGNAGIGKETARGLAAAGAHVIILCRNPEKGKLALADLKESMGNLHIEMMLCDLADLHDIHRFAQEFQQKYPALHVLINNAGMIQMKRGETKDGIEATFGVNYLAHFYLVHLLLPHLQRSQPARIINLTSAVHRAFGIRWHNLQSRGIYWGQQAYSNSKSAMILFTYKLARMLQDTQISALAVHPGYVKTTMNTTGFPKIFLWLSQHWTHQLTPKEGAQTTIVAAMDPKYAEQTGLYFSKQQPSRSAHFTYKKRLQDRLWELSEQLLMRKIGTWEKWRNASPNINKNK